MSDLNVLLHAMFTISTFECELFTRRVDNDVKLFTILIKKLILNAIVELEKKGFLRKLICKII